MYNRNQNPLEEILTPEQQQFADLLLMMDFRDALKEMDLPVEKVRYWLCECGFRGYVDALQVVLADDVYRQVIKQAKDMLQEITNLQEHLTIPQRTEALESIINLVSKAQEKCQFKGYTSRLEDYMDACSWRAHVAGEDDDEDEDQEEEQPEENRHHSSSAQELPIDPGLHTNTFPPEHVRVYNPLDFFTPEQWEEIKKSDMKPPNGVVYDESAPRKGETSGYIPDPNAQVLASDTSYHKGPPPPLGWT